MAAQRDHRATLEYLRSKVNGSFTSQPTGPMKPALKPMEIWDTDIDSDSQSESGDDSSPSVRSLDTSSVTTASTPDIIKTPDSTGLTAFHFHIDGSPITGPEGPHLFRMSNGSMDIKSTVEIDLIFDNDVERGAIPCHTSASTFEPERRDTPFPNVPAPSASLQTVINRSSDLDETRVASWSPQNVVSWLQKLNFDDGIIQRFFINDISGAILLELQQEDLKELDIQSFGKRHQLMAAIRSLRNVTFSNDRQPSLPLEPVSREPTPYSTAADIDSRSCNATPVPFEGSSLQTENEGLHQHLEQGRGRVEAIAPNDSVSIVGIEQVFPKLHSCSKGEDCRKWQRQYARLARLAQGLPADTVGNPMVITGDPGNALYARNLVKGPKSEMTSSIVASSDALGPNHVPEVFLSEEKLHEVEPRDPQENVRNFLNFQRLSQLQPAFDPATPPMDNLPSPEVYSPGTLTDNLRSLPRLRIPSDYGPSPRTASVLSGQRTVTPSVLMRNESFQQPVTEHSGAPYVDLFSPSDYYRQDPRYRESSPVSEVDVPLTAIPLGPVERNCSQSVPPDMRFGNGVHYAAIDPINRPESTKVDNHNGKIPHPHIGHLHEGRKVYPIETPADLERTPRAGNYRFNPFAPSGEATDDIIHSGWMKKRKTTRLLRHEWNEHAFALRGTQLGMFETEEAAQQDSKALEYIDADDYAVACSSLASSSKLTAAFKKTVLKRTDDTRGGTAFAFSLIPQSNTTATTDRKTLFSNGPKSHHFAVKTRDERIDWMRELMLAKALRRGRESGACLNVNGNAI
ncbi:Sterile alpha motif type 2 [Penicillium longicatenatum]|nr:Sterile alpha motif type 2 [Penicillium longicatenatum]